LWYSINDALGLGCFLRMGIQVILLIHWNADIGGILHVDL